jgi:hypothetical protein
MKISKIIYSLVAVMGLLLMSCEDLSEVNQNPNSPEEVSANYIMSYVLTHSAKAYYALGAEGSDLSGAMQYIQMGTNEGATRINQYGWSAASWSEYYNILKNNDLMYQAAVRDNNRFFQAIALTMKSFVFGLMTDLFGDIPYSEALQAASEQYYPRYDSQLDVYKGILTDLKTASTLLGSLGATDVVSAGSDVLYGGKAASWKKFANALRMRYALRLSAKKAEASAAGIDIVAEFKDAAGAAFTANGDDATMAFIGTTKDNSAAGGLLNASNPLYYIKPSKSFIDKLTALGDPRRDRWFQPVLNKWDAKATTATDKTVTNAFGENFTVKYMPAKAGANVDTSLYVGLPVGLAIVDATSYNKGDDGTAYNPERSPYISFLHNRYRTNTEAYVKMNLITYAEVEFMLAEAALDGSWGISGTAEDHYKSGIKASLDKYNAQVAAGFSFDRYYAQNAVSLASASNKLERISEQKWIAGWLSVEPWINWRRTGFPALKTGPAAQFGAAIPVRFVYPIANADVKYLVNYNAAVNKLEPTSFVPTGQSKDHQYSKMWLLKGTSAPW